MTPHPGRDLGRHPIPVGAVDGPEQDVGTALDGFDETSAAHADGGDEDGGGFENGFHGFDESLGESLHLPDLVDKENVAAAVGELVRSDAVECSEVDAVLTDPMQRSDAHVSENGAVAIEGLDSKADALR